VSGRPLYVFGAGGHGKVVAEAARWSVAHRLRAFLDDDVKRWGQEWDGLPVLGGRQLFASLEDDAEVALGVGGNALRADLFACALEWGRTLATLVHPTAVVARGVALGPGTYVGPRAVLHTDAQVGQGCIVNSGAIVEHDCRIGNWVHVSPGATLGGAARIGDGAHVALGAIVLPGLTLGPWTTLGAGAVMVHSLPDHATALGVPARVRDPKRRPA
jgi:sugar O-acyltransferase (sialic acid O-acetyltransferase NeuD family)